MGIYADIQKKQQAVPKAASAPIGRASIRNDRLFMKFPFTPLLVQAIKRLTDRRYEKDNGGWSALLCVDNVRQLEELGFDFSIDLADWKDGIVRETVVDPLFECPGLNHKLAPYQNETIQVLDAWGGRALLADDPGLGKTAEALGWVAWRNAYPLLVICPSFLKYNWVSEINHWVTSGKTVQVVSGMEETNIFGDIVIINYDILARQEGDYDVVRSDIFSKEWKTLVVEEAHYISNKDTIRAWAVGQIAANIPHVIPITATPGKSKPVQMFNAINMVNPKVFPSFFKYGHRYCGPKMGAQGVWEFKGSSNEEELNDLLTKTVMIRHRKQDVYPQMERKRRVPVLIGNPPPAEAYAEKVLKNFSFGNIEKLKQEALKAKLPDMIKWVSDMLETEDKIIIFGEHKSTLDAFMDAFGDIAVRVDGDASDKEKESAIHEFQRCAKCGVRKERHNTSPDACDKYEHNMKARIFLGSRAAKEGATLTAASNVIFTELWWSMRDHDQAEDRCYGRVSDMHGCTAWYLLAAGTIEEEIARIISIRERKMSKVMDGEEIDRNMLLSHLIAHYKEAV